MCKFQGQEEGLCPHVQLKQPVFLFFVVSLLLPRHYNSAASAIKLLDHFLAEIWPVLTSTLQTISRQLEWFRCCSQNRTCMQSDCTDMCRAMWIGFSTQEYSQAHSFIYQYTSKSCCFSHRALGCQLIVKKNCQVAHFCKVI